MKQVSVIKVCIVVLAVLGAVGCRAASDLVERKPPATRITPVETASEVSEGTKPFGVKETPDAENAPYDLQVIDTISANYGQAIEMARLAEVKAQHVELKQLARKIVEDSERLTSQMKVWRVAWYEDAPLAVNPKMPGMRDSTNAMDIRDLNEAASMEFDMLLLDVMRILYQGAIEIWQGALARVTHGELKQLGRQTIGAHEAEIMQMNRWRSEWDVK